MHRIHALAALSVAGAAVLALAASMAFVTTPAQAHERQAQISGSDGQTRSRNSTRDGQGKAWTTITRAHGGTVTREATRNLP